MKTSVSSISALLAFIVAAPAAAQDSPTWRSRDRDNGIPASIFGTYIGRGELLIYPFFAYSQDHDREYQPIKLGYGLIEDYRGRYWDNSQQIFIGYGVTDRIAVELEAGYIRAILHKARNDTSATPARIEEAGFADIEGQLRVRLAMESDGRPELFGYLELTAPSQRRDVLIGDRLWSLRPGLGLIRGFSWGTMTIRVNTEYNREAAHWDLGEFSIEYLKRLSPAWRLNLAFEGGETGAFDEWDLVSGVQWRLSDFLLLKLDNAVGLSPKATDWAPQIGVIISLPH